MSTGRPLLVVVGGLPASGKSTVSELLARRLPVPYLRVDRIEQAIVANSPLTRPRLVVDSVRSSPAAAAERIAGEVAASERRRRARRGRPADEGARRIVVVPVDDVPASIRSTGVPVRTATSASWDRSSRSGWPRTTRGSCA